MQLILAIDSDPRRSEQLASLVHARLKVDLVQSTSAGEGLHALKDRIPDLILTSPLLSPFDDGVLDEYLRELGAAGAHVQTVRIPILTLAPSKKGLADRLFVLGRTKPTSPATPDGCDPTVFADEIALYLTRAVSARQSVAQLAQALSAREDEAPQSPLAATPAVHSTVMSEVSEAIIEEFADAVDLSHGEVAEPRYVQPAAPSHDIVSDPTYVVEETESWPVDEPMYIEPDEPMYIEPTESSHFDQTVSTAAPIVDPMPAAEQTPPHEPARKGTSATFEAALAAIRAAWVKPEAPLTILSPPTEAAAPRNTAPGKVDPPAQRDVVRKTRPENRRRENETSEQRPKQDEWGIFDPDQGGFSAVVDKLDKVAESKDGSPRTSGTSRVISIR
jgi:hypothetical protein